MVKIIMRIFRQFERKEYLYLVVVFDAGVTLNITRGFLLGKTKSFNPSVLKLFKCSKRQEEASQHFPNAWEGRCH